jgi:hypothetical protein
MHGIISGRLRPPHEVLGMKARLVIMWLVVGVPLLWGTYETLLKAMKLFQ